MDGMLILLYAFPLIILLLGIAMVFRAKNSAASTISVRRNTGGQDDAGFSVDHSMLEPMTNTNGLPMISGTGIDVGGNPFGS